MQLTPGFALRLCCVLALLTGTIAQAVPLLAAQQKRVLVIYSSRRDSQVVIVGERTLPRLLEEHLGSVDYHSEYLDQSRFPDAAYHTAFQTFLGRKYGDVQFDAIIVPDGSSLEVVRSTRHDLFPGVPLVFFSTTPLEGPLANATGLVVELNLHRTLDLVAALQPDVRTVYVVTGAAPGDREYERLAREQFAPYAGRFTLSYLSGLPTSDLMSRLAALPADSAVYYLVANRDGDGAFVHPLELIDRLTATANAPVYCWVDSAMGLGIVGGSLKDQQLQIEALGQLAVRVLSGEPAESIPVSSPDLNVTQIDSRQLQRWQIPESRIPVGARVLFRTPSVWDRYKGYILGTAGILLVQTLLIAGLLVQWRRRRSAEAQVRGGEEALRSSYQRIRDLGSRLLTAQDSERARIARDLHDDISQQIALLSIDLELLGGAVRADNEALADAVSRTSSLARSVHELSHRLYPVKLRLIGLVGALQALTRELSRAEQVISFTHAGVPPALPPGLTLSLFRIAQEILHNAVKYSQARGIGVGLRGVAGALVLTVEDDGVGFEVAEAWGKGLGLVSIRERVEAVGGKWELHSAPGAGVSSTIRVPLAAVGTDHSSVTAAAG